MLVVTDSKQDYSFVYVLLSFLIFYLFGSFFRLNFGFGLG